MPVVDHLKPRGKFRTVVHFDSHPPVELLVETVFDEGVRTGRDLTPERILQIVELDRHRRARDDALRLIRYSPRTTSQLAERLRKKRHSPAAVSAAIRYAADHGYLDDAGYALQWARARLQRKPRGPILLRAELFKKGIARALIDDVCARVFTPEDLDGLAKRAAEEAGRKYRKFKKGDKTRKVIQFLIRRGFDYSTASRVSRADDISS